MVTEITWRELDGAAFGRDLDACLAVYAAAMNPPPDQLPGRQMIMGRHVWYPRFHGLAGSAEGPSGPIVAFAYGFHSEPGQWWHDFVAAGIAASAGPGAVAWLADTFEISEVHVLPAYQNRGIGREMLLMLTSGRSERAAVLSTRDTQSPARHLYRKLGFTDLLTDFRFPGGTEAYAVMGAELPLRSG